VRPRVHALFQSTDLPQGRFHGVVSSVTFGENGRVSIRLDGENCPQRLRNGARSLDLLLVPGVSLEPGDFVIASYLGNGAVTFHHIEREQTSSVVIYSDGTSE
jgi:hypothetical protein